jgi:polysaccharide biosynthesis protein PslH
MIDSICIVANQRPYPPFHGANADIWRIITAIKIAGVAVHCVAWKDSISAHVLPAPLYTDVDSYLEFLMTSNTSGLKESWKEAGFNRVRRLTPEQKREAVEFARDRGCKAVMAIGLYGGELAHHVADSLDIPLYYRSHAIETEYYRHHFGLERRADGNHPSQFVRDQVELRSIARAEHRLLSRSAKVFEISCDDLQSRQRRPSNQIVHLPPLAPTLNSEMAPPWESRPYDIGYLGNLFMTNNQQGLHWFLKSVLPLIRKNLPAVRVLVAGKVSDPRVLPPLKEYGVDVMPNPAHAHEVANAIRVGINPIFSGNGTTVKTIDLLWAGCGVVTTPIGAQGYGFTDPDLPIKVATSPQEFGDCILRMLEEAPITTENTRFRLNSFSLETAGKRVLDEMGVPHA